MRRWTSLIAILLLGTGTALGQPATKPAAPEKPPTLDELYDKLAKAPDDREAVRLQRDITRQQMMTPSDTSFLLMQRVIRSVQAGKLDMALTLLNAILREDPDYTEAWNRRATVYFLKNDYVRASADLAQTLRRDPRHLGAWKSLSLMLEAVGNKKQAYEAMQRSLTINPRQPSLRKQVDDLKPQIEGQDI